MICRSFCTSSMLLILLLVFTASVHGAPVGNIADPAILKHGVIVEEGAVGFVGGLEIDVVGDRKLENQKGNSEFEFMGLRLGATIRDRAVVYVLLGEGKADHGYTASGTDVRIETDGDLVWGVGCNLIVSENELRNGDKVIMGLHASYRKADLDVDKVTIGSTSFSGASLANTDAEWDFSEWQLAFAVSYQLEFFVPYIGVKYSDVSGTAKVRDNSGAEYKVDFDPDRRFGFFFGGGLDIAERASLTLEARVLDETALTATCVIRF